MPRPPNFSLFGKSSRPYKGDEEKDTGSPLEITPPLRGSRRSQAARRRLRRWGAQGHPRRWPLHPHLTSSPIKGEKTKRKSRRTRRSAPTRTLAPDSLLSCPARSGIQRLCFLPFSLAHFPHEAGNRERAGVRGKRKSGRRKRHWIPAENHSPLEGESPKPSRQAPAEAVGGSGAPAPLAPSPSPSSSPIKGEETKRKSRRTRRSAPTNTLAPTSCCHARPDRASSVFVFGLSPSPYFPHEAGNRERAGVRGE